MLITDQQPHKPLPLPELEELICSDDTPVDNEDQNLLPNLLLTSLLRLWADRHDWFFGVDMGIFHTTGTNPNVPVVPDAFLSLGVERRQEGHSRRSYVVWKEGGVVPAFVLEMVSYTARNEYQDKLEIYRQLGVLYCAVYNPEFWQRDHHDPFEVYRLENDRYVRQAGEPVWMPEIGLGLGRYLYQCWGMEKELLVWFDEDGHIHGIPEVTREELLREHRRAERERLRAERERLRAEQERLRADELERSLEAEQQRTEQERLRAEAAEAQTQRLADYLRSMGVDPEHLPSADDRN